MVQEVGKSEAAMEARLRAQEEAHRQEIRELQRQMHLVIGRSQTAIRSKVWAWKLGEWMFCAPGDWGVMMT